ncbi:MAG: hypothetical protein ACD_73C00358G0001, partial [uncultured bacterium]
MNIIKHFVVLGALVIMFILNVAPVQAALVNGSIHTQDGTMDLTYNEDGLGIRVSFDAEGYTLGKASSKTSLGQIFVVRSNGTFFVSAKAFRDAYGIIIAKPTSAKDKVVYLNNQGSITGGIGLNVLEVKNLLKSYQVTEATKTLPFFISSRFIQLMDNLEIAAGDIDSSDDIDAEFVFD